MTLCVVVVWSPAGERVLPFSAMVCNFTKPTPSQPSLLDHDEVVTYFHEFGHIMHFTCSRTKLNKFNAFGVEQVRAWFVSL